MINLLNQSEYLLHYLAASSHDALSRSTISCFLIENSHPVKEQDHCDICVVSSPFSANVESGLSYELHRCLLESRYDCDVFLSYSRHGWTTLVCICKFIASYRPITVTYVIKTRISISRSTRNMKNKYKQCRILL